MQRLSWCCIDAGATLFQQGVLVDKNVEFLKTKSWKFTQNHGNSKKIMVIHGNSHKIMEILTNHEYKQVLPVYIHMCTFIYTFT